MEQEQLQGEDQRQLAEGVILYKKFERVENNPDMIGLFTWKLQITVLSCIDFEVDLDQSENIELENAVEGELKTVSKIQPFETKVVAKVKLKNDWKLKSKFKLIMTVPEKQSQYGFIEKYVNELKEEVIQFDNSFKKIPFEHLTIEESENILKKNNMKFIDMEFCPNDDSVLSCITDGQLKDCFDYVIHWRRAIDAVEIENTDSYNKKLCVFSHSDISPDDIDQGLLADNHVLSTFSALAEKYNLIKRIFKQDKYSEYGIYQVKLCINGEWVTVVIDDLFPCIPLGKPLVSESESKDLWLLILEKALAKSFGSYYNLTLYNMLNFFLTLTGCPTQIYNITPEDNEAEVIDKLYTNVNEKKYLVVAISKDINEEDYENNEDELNQNLTVGNFGYTILDVKKRDKENLIVIRKVWNDESKKEILQEYTDKFLRFHQDISDSNFDKDLVLSYSDFIKEFDSYVVCYSKNWDEVRVRGKFINVNESNSNVEVTTSKWYYSIQLEKVTNLIVSLFQDDDQDRGESSRKQLMDISLTVIKKDSSKNEISHFKTIDFSRSSNLQLELNVPPGQYIILPRTSGCFFGRPANKVEVEETQIYDYSTKKFNPIFINTIKDIFKKFDLLLNRKLGYNEFKGFWECICKIPIDENYFKEHILNKYQSHEEGLTEPGFISFFEEEFLTEDGEEKVKEWLRLLGYDKELYPIKSRTFMLTFHSDNPVSVAVRDALNTDLNSKVNQIILGSMGKELLKTQDNNISLICYSSQNFNMASIGCLNNNNVKYLVKLKFKRNENNDITLSSKIDEIEKVIAPKDIEFYYHLNLNNNEIDGDLFEIECSAMPDKK